MSVLERVTVTIPADVRTAADREAKRLRRSRSWVVAEAVRRWLLGGETRSAGRRAGESAPAPYAAEEVAAARRRHLAAEFALPPAERLRRSEALARLARSARPRAPRHQVIGFDSYEAYYDWKKGRLVGA